MKNTIEVPADMTNEDILKDPYAAAIFDGAKDYSVEMEPDSLEIYGDFKLREEK